MDKFTSDFWGWFVAVPIVVSLVWVLWLLYRYTHNDAETQKHLAGKTFDGIGEGANPLPGWWVKSLLGLIVFSIGYLVLYPGLGAFPGVLGWTSQSEVEQESALAKQQKKQLVDDILRSVSVSPDVTDYSDVVALSKHPRSLAMGQRVFQTYCIACHAVDARGNTNPAKNIGFPNLRDKQWNWGSTPEAITQTIAAGRLAAMPAWQPIIGDQGVKEVVAYVRQLSGTPHNAELAAAGKAVFTANCVACHADAGTGNPLVGAPDLTKNIWLYGGDEATLTKTIANGRNGQMPAHGALLSETNIKLVAAYIYSFAANPE